MKVARSRLGAVLALSMLQMHAMAAGKNAVDIRAYMNDSCIIADEPYFVPATADSSSDQTTKMFPLLGIVVGKLAELFINYVGNKTAGHISAGGARKDTRYAASKEMNLYRAQFQPAPRLSLNAKLGCMTVVAAKFKPDSTDCTADYVPKELAPETMKLPQAQWQTSRTDDSIENQLRRANVCVDGKVKAEYEARLEFSDDGTAYRMKSAGYRIESLLTTNDKNAKRNVFYTMAISQPGATDQHEQLSTAWVHLGTVSAGAHASAAVNESPPWLRVPALSLEARRAYEEQTKAHQEVMGEIEALKRALTRNQRLLDGLDARITAASADVAAGLAQQRTKTEVEIQIQEAELDARNAEYRDLPQKPLEFMPVSVEVAVTESESEKTALLVLAGLVSSETQPLASAGSSASAGVFTRSFNMADAQARPDPAAALERARADYYDALVAQRTAGSAALPGDAATHELALAKDKYNDARRALGLELIE